MLGFSPNRRPAGSQALRLTEVALTYQYLKYLGFVVKGYDETRDDG